MVDVLGLDIEYLGPPGPPSEIGDDSSDDVHPSHPCIAIETNGDDELHDDLESFTEYELEDLGLEPVPESDEEAPDSPPSKRRRTF